MFLPLITGLPRGLIPVCSTCQKFFACISSLVEPKLDCLSLLPVASCHIWSKNETPHCGPKAPVMEYSPPLSLAPYQLGSCSMRLSCSQLFSPLTPPLEHTPPFRTSHSPYPAPPCRCPSDVTCREAFADYPLKESPVQLCALLCFLVLHVACHHLKSQFNELLCCWYLPPPWRMGAPWSQGLCLGSSLCPQLLE